MEEIAKVQPNMMKNLEKSIASADDLLLADTDAR